MSSNLPAHNPMANAKCPYVGNHRWNVEIYEKSINAERIVIEQWVWIYIIRADTIDEAIRWAQSAGKDWRLSCKFRISPHLEASL